jgi:signal transduction histidine kinase
MTTRARAVLAAALSTLLAVIVLGSAVNFLVSRHLRTALDRTLHTRAAEVAQLAASAPKLLTSQGALDTPIGATQALVEVVDSRGRIVARSASLGRRVLPQQLATRAIAGHSSYGEAILGSTRLRVYSAPLADLARSGGGGAVIVAASTDDERDTMREVRTLTVFGGLAAALAGAAAVWLLMGRALRPLARLDRGAADIGRTGDASGRLPVPRRDDEVGRLATTLNRMLDTLERTRENERRFVADASHELRTPLTALRGNVDHLARHGPTPELVADLKDDAERLARLADDLLLLSRLDAAAAPANGEVRLDELARNAGADGWVGDPVSVNGDRDALARAVGNLVENARRHGSGRVTVTTLDVHGLALLEVEDEGAGVADDERERVFERFHGRGSGLGLAIVRATAERHGGTAYAHGARFTLELPAVRKASDRVDTPQGEPEKGTP